MRDENSDTWTISVCGLNCAKCDMYEASHGNEKVRDEIVQWFKEKRNKTLQPEQIRCEGCRGPLDAHWSEDCRMLSCATQRGLQYCFQCSDFPCTKLKDFCSDGVAHHKRTVENLARMKEIGVQAWIAEQKAKGPSVFCP